MRTYLLTILSLLAVHSGFAQPAVCLRAGETKGSIVYDTAAVDRLIHPARYKAVLFGEMHNGTFNPEFEYRLITHLHRSHGFRHIFFEMSIASAWHYNEYLRTGDTSQLSNRTMVANYGQWRGFWERMRTYNALLPDSMKIVFHGVDFERTEVFSTIIQLAPQGVHPPSVLQAAMDTAAAHAHDEPLYMYDVVAGKFKEHDNSSFVSALRFIQEQLHMNEDAGRTYFGDNYPVIRDIAANNGRVIVMPKPRNRTMYQTMRRMIREQQIDRFIGVFGAQHVIYTQRSALSNAVRKLAGIRRRDVLVVQELVYNLDHGTAGYSTITENIRSLNGDCKARILPAAAVPGYRRKADYVLIGDAVK